MLRPIKSFFTYMQKNAVKSTGDVSETADVVVADLEDKVVDKDKDNEQQEQKPKLAIEQVAKRRKSSLDEETVKSLSEENNKEIAESIAMPSLEDTEDDIELQIKSCLVRKPTATASALSAATSRNTCRELVRLIIEPSHAPDHNQNHALENNEMLKELQRSPLAPIVDEVYSVGSTTEDEEDIDVEEVVPFVPIVAVVDELRDELHSPFRAGSSASEDPLEIDGLTPSKLLPTVTSSCSPTDLNLAIWVNAENDTNTTPPASRSLFSPTISIIPLPVAEGPVRPVAENVKEVTSNNQNLPTPTTEITIKTTATTATATAGEVEELRSDGSDSGLGSESALQHLRSIVNESHCAEYTDCISPLTGPNIEDLQNIAEDNELGAVGCSTMLPCVESIIDISTTAIEPVPEPAAIITVPSSSCPKPLRSSLKRRLDSDSITDGPSTSAAAALAIMSKKPRRNVSFASVTLFYFPRVQGFGCVPTVGGCTLGMAARHISSKQMSLIEHAAETRRAHRTQPHERAFSSDDSETSEEDFLSEGSGSDLDGDSNGFLQPVSPKVRRAMLKAAGVRRIDAYEKIECRNIRNSREVCGCSCRDYCDPDTCSCSVAGIRCQVDRPLFPCGCTRDGCGNSSGRVEFNPNRVRTHYIHTIMRLAMDNRPQRHRTLCDSSSSRSIVDYSSNTDVREASHSSPGFYSLQPQSNYSSGYGSPAYSGDSSASFYLPQNTHCSLSSPSSASGNITNQQNSPYILESLDTGWSHDNLSYTIPSAVQSQDNSSIDENDEPSYDLQTPALSLSLSPSSLATTISNFVSPKSPILTARTTFAPTTAITQFSSCAVPSEPPFGTATTTEIVTNCQSNNNTIYTNSSICVSDIEIGCNNTSYIELSTPLASSTRLSQLNSLLESTQASLASFGDERAAQSLMTNNNFNHKDKAIIDGNEGLKEKSNTSDEKKVSLVDNLVDGVIENLNIYTPVSTPPPPAQPPTTSQQQPPTKAAAVVIDVDNITVRNSECVIVDDVMIVENPKDVVDLEKVEKEKLSKAEAAVKKPSELSKDPKVKKVLGAVLKQNQKVATKLNEKIKTVAKKSLSLTKSTSQTKTAAVMAKKAPTAVAVTSPTSAASIACTTTTMAVVNALSFTTATTVISTTAKVTTTTAISKVISTTATPKVTTTAATSKVTTATTKVTTAATPKVTTTTTTATPKVAATTTTVTPKVITTATPKVAPSTTVTPKVTTTATPKVEPSTTVTPKVTTATPKVEPSTTVTPKVTTATPKVTTVSTKPEENYEKITTITK